MTVRVVNFLGRSARDALDASGLDVEVIDPREHDEPPAGLRADVMYGGWGDPVAIEAWAEHVGWVQLPGTGIDGVSPRLFEGRVVTNLPGASAVPISEFVLGAMLAFAKAMPEVWLHDVPERWNVHEMSQLDGKCLGLLGLGGIGTAVATRARAFGMAVRARRQREAPSPVPGVEVVGSLDELLAGADHLVLAAPSTPGTRHLLDAAAFDRVKPGVHLVNVARGTLVDQEALRAALDDGRVARATLDTVEPEPLPAGHWMYTHPRVRLSAHVSWCSERGLARAHEMFVENLRRYVRQEPLAWVVDLERGY